MGHYDDCGEPQSLPDSAIEQQVGGNHYCKLKIQPLQLAYSLNASPCFCKLAKYITRDKDDKMIQYHKALHVIELEKELISDKVNYGSFYSSNSYLEILKFSKQFEESFLITDALENMFHKRYNLAREAVELLISYEEL